MIGFGSVANVMLLNPTCKPWNYILSSIIVGQHFEIFFFLVNVWIVFSMERNGMSLRAHKEQTCFTVFFLVDTKKKGLGWITDLGTNQLFFFWLFLPGGPLNWTMWKYMNVPRKCRKAVADTSTGNKSGRRGGGTRATLATLRAAMMTTLA